jgi:hypothetical protein
MDHDDYGTYDDDYSAQQEIGNFAYMPKNFLGISTADLGFSRPGQVSPFLQLKEKIITDKSISAEDRMQGIRYLCAIPYSNGTQHCVEAVKSIIEDDSIDIYKRFHFINSKEKFLRIDDHVADLAYPIFFAYGLKAGGLEVPMELQLLCGEYIFHSYSPDSEIRQSVLDYCLDTVDKNEEDITTQLKVISFLLAHGQQDEIEFAENFLDQLGLKSPNDAKPSEIEVIARGILRQLQTKYIFVDNINAFLDALQSSGATEAQCNLLIEVFERLSVDTINADDIASLVYQSILDLSKENSFVGKECLGRIVREALTEQQASHDVIYKMIASLDGFVEERPLTFGWTPLEKLRNDIFAALQAALMTEVEESLRRDVFESLESTDKSVAKEFLHIYDPEDEIWEKYKSSMNKETFKETYDKVIKEWLH